MTLKRIVTETEYKALGESVKELYKNVDGEYRLDLEPDPEVSGLKGKVREFRDTNVDLMKRLEALEGNKPEEQKITSEENDELVQLRDRLSRWETEREAEKAELAREKMDNYIRRVSKDKAIMDTAVEDVILRSRNFGFRLDEEGTPRAYRKDGKVIASEKSPDLDMPFDEWISGQIKSSPHWMGNPVGSQKEKTAYGNEPKTYGTKEQWSDPKWVAANAETIDSGEMGYRD